VLVPTASRRFIPATTYRSYQSHRSYPWHRPQPIEHEDEHEHEDDMTLAPPPTIAILQALNYRRDTPNPYE
jgi:hypothetical protein